jgi:hypothetical protein
MSSTRRKLLALLAPLLAVLLVLVRWLLIVLAVAFIGLYLIIPL